MEGEMAKLKDVITAYEEMYGDLDHYGKWTFYRYSQQEGCSRAVIRVGVHCKEEI